MNCFKDTQIRSNCLVKRLNLKDCRCCLTIILPKQILCISHLQCPHSLKKIVTRNLSSMNLRKSLKKNLIQVSGWLSALISDHKFELLSNNALNSNKRRCTGNFFITSPMVSFKDGQLKGVMRSVEAISIEQKQTSNIII